LPIKDQHSRASAKKYSEGAMEKPRLKIALISLSLLYQRRFRVTLGIYPRLDHLKGKLHSRGLRKK